MSPGDQNRIKMPSQPAASKRESVSYKHASCVPVPNQSVHKGGNIQYILCCVGIKVWLDKRKHSATGRKMQYLCHSHLRCCMISFVDNAL